MQKIYVAQKAVILDSEGKLLTIRRSQTHRIDPGGWDLPGGDLEFGEDPMVGIIREVREETGLSEVHNLAPYDVEGHVAVNQEYWVTIAYRGNSGENKVTLSNEHDDFQWVTMSEFIKLKSSPKLRRFIQKLWS
ncbi:MAG: NUDIX hydrolase [Candidatus Sungbacteria bacterium]|uniref:NUDIX hydrolase n=1 Tax=Candidatus Sungiibacteriota bacterium TaxID=2750080 RepID=A0A933DT95_9BACT|nr:NUDIX hydrolase [Candidatus Sungbacteria bacterium]